MSLAKYIVLFLRTLSTQFLAFFYVIGIYTILDPLCHIKYTFRDLLDIKEALKWRELVISPRALQVFF